MTIRNGTEPVDSVSHRVIPAKWVSGFKSHSEHYKVTQRTETGYGAGLSGAAGCPPSRRILRRIFWGGNSSWGRTMAPAEPYSRGRIRRLRSSGSSLRFATLTLIDAQSGATREEGDGESRTVRQSSDIALSPRCSGERAVGATGVEQTGVCSTKGGSLPLQANGISVGDRKATARQEPRPPKDDRPDGHFLPTGAKKSIR